MWHPDEFLEKLYRKLETGRSKRVETTEQKQARLRRRLREALGFVDHLEEWQAPLEPVLLERAERDDFVRERVEYSTSDGLRVPAYVLIPRGAEPGRTPAVLAWHGHGYGSREAVGLLPDGSELSGPPGIHANFALELVRRGLVVLVPEIVGFGDRKLRRDVERDPKAGNSCFSIASELLLAGSTIAGLRVFEAMRAADYLTARPEVDPLRIGNMGFSGGGMVASLSAALDERIRASVICGYSNTYKGSILARPHCLDNYIPGILTEAEMPDLLGLIAPRALFIESGTFDGLFPVERVKEAIGQVAQTYGALNAEARFTFDLFEGKHEISGRHSYDWLAKMLRQEPAV
ncbi:alpha/beta hydrolase family protein [Paenibacillus ginsengihumi]|uniref:alpha/beta hydrolase family protein n=1 Tax=Paenibacillus ginsengihumi TaxID=431596 RepID=UPI000373480E|nr:alpha/beta hydrolase family protein [Paenibacillus ginsengihumi]